MKLPRRTIESNEVTKDVMDNVVRELHGVE
jgi:hypothetical protein